MGKIDTEAKSYLSNPDRFSDIFNFWIYDGIKVIKPEELQELDTNSLAIPYQHKIKKHVQKYRDLLKLYTAKQDQHNIYLILGIEIEAKTHYAMPVRNMLYDAMNYAILSYPHDILRHIKFWIFSRYIHHKMRSAPMHMPIDERLPLLIDFVY